MVSYSSSSSAKSCCCNLMLINKRISTVLHKLVFATNNGYYKEATLITNHSGKVQHIKFQKGMYTDVGCNRAIMERSNIDLSLRLPYYAEDNTNDKESSSTTTTQQDQSLHSITAASTDDTKTTSLPQVLLSSVFNRRISMLESKLFSQYDETKPSIEEQLTIFYKGHVTVFDNIPLHKAQAVHLLAGKSFMPNPPRALRPEVPIARHVSLQHFLKKRQNRISHISPYFIANSKDKKNEATTYEVLSNGDQIGMMRNFSPLL